MTLRVNVLYPVLPGTKKQAPGLFPVLLTQTPYGKDSALMSALGGGEENDLVQHGYIAVMADVRGRGGSNGTFDLWSARETRDGGALARWSANLPGSNGKVGLFGLSYMGITQLLTSGAIGKNSPIKAAVPEVAINDAPQDGFYGGMPNGGFGFLYAGLFVATGLAGIPDYLGLDKPLDLVKRALQTTQTSLGFGGGMVADFLTGGPLAFDGPEWKSKAPAGSLQGIVDNKIPTLVVGGWYDIMGKGPLMNFVGLQNAAAGRATYLPMLPGQKPDPRFQVIVGPWTHAGIDKTLMSENRLRWFDYWLKGEKTDAVADPNVVHLNLLGTNRWIESPTWPLRETRSTVYYLGAGRSSSPALSLNSGDLTPQPPGAGQAADKVAWTGVSSPCSVRFKVQTAGMLDLLKLPTDQLCGTMTEQTTEVGALTYTTAPFSTQKVVAGPIAMKLYASSTTKDAEFIVGLSRVQRNGQVESITSGALLGSQRTLVEPRTWRDTAGRVVQPYHAYTKESLTPLKRGAVTEFDISINPTAFVLEEGERLRITISTSDIPFALPGLNLLPNLLGGVYNIQRNQTWPSQIVVPMADLQDLHTCTTMCHPVG